jgi:murein peptide amidase A
LLNPMKTIFIRSNKTESCSSTFPAIRLSFMVLFALMMSLIMLDACSASAQKMLVKHEDPCLSGQVQATDRNQGRYESETGSSSAQQPFIIGYSVEKRPIEAVAFGTGADTVLILAGIHGDETGAVKFVERLKSEMSSRSLTVHALIRCIVVSGVNPDGMCRKTRVNASGVDVNRNFPTENWGEYKREGRYFCGPRPGSEPETMAVMRLIQECSPRVILVLHEPLKVVNYDGPAEMLAQKISRLNHYPLEGDIGYPTPGSLGTYAGKERKIPVITLELENGAAQVVWDANREAMAELLAKPLDDEPSADPVNSQGIRP